MAYDRFVIVYLTHSGGAMFGKIISSFTSSPQDDSGDDATRRRFARRAGDSCVTIIDGKIYPVENWSMGGFMIAADDRLFAVDEPFEVTMKFKLRDTILDVPHMANVVRKSQNRVAMQFQPMTKAIRDSFQQVVDDFVSRSFTDSQMS